MSTSPHQLPWIEEGRRPICNVPWMGASQIQADGRVTFCCFTDASAGNVNEKSFDAVWNGPVMQRIRAALVEHELPPECQTTACPIYRGDDVHHMFEAMGGRHRYHVTNTHDPHAAIRDALAGTQLCDNGHALEVHWTGRPRNGQPRGGQPMRVDVVAATRCPDGALRFLPDGDEFAIPFVQYRELRQEYSPVVLRVPTGALPPGTHALTVALFEAGADPNLLSNCYWSVHGTLAVPAP